MEKKESKIYVDWCNFISLWWSNDWNIHRRSFEITERCIYCKKPFRNTESLSVHVRRSHQSYYLSRHFDSALQELNSKTLIFKLTGDIVKNEDATYKVFLKDKNYLIAEGYWDGSYMSYMFHTLDWDHMEISDHDQINKFSHILNRKREDERYQLRLKQQKVGSVE